MSQGNDPIQNVSEQEFSDKLVSVCNYHGNCVAYVFVGRTPKAQLAISLDSLGAYPSKEALRDRVRELIPDIRHLNIKFQF